LRLTDSCITQLIRLKNLLEPVTRVKKKKGVGLRESGGESRFTERLGGQWIE